MKKLLTLPTGGMPFNLADLRWLTSGLSESISGILSTVCPLDEVIILSGCERSLDGSMIPTITISSGFVVYQSEVFRVLEHSYTLGVGQEYWTIDTVFDPLGLKAYNTVGVYHETYEEKIFKVTTGAPPIDSTLYNIGNTFLKRIADNLPKEDWSNFITQTIPSGYVAPGTYNIDCLKDLNGFVHLRGLHHTGEDPSQGNVNILLGTLPIGYRPDSQLVFPIIVLKSASLGTNLISIDVNGEIRVKFHETDYVSLFEFTQIPPFKAG